MNQQSKHKELIAALSRIPTYDNPLNPLFAALARSQPLTLAAIRQQSELLHQNADQMEKQTLAVKRVVASCQQIYPIPLLQLPLGF